ncbi:hypothetical protein I1A62_02785 (plasmid) [Rhodococcus sp. USK10]|nr:hypothetical protein [Rhodococcus sp. USK10]QYB00054.1 hypothetical protein I1A62_02785 [Rhodococcus sp. USK10]
MAVSRVPLRACRGRVPRFMTVDISSLAEGVILRPRGQHSTVSSDEAFL